eukprot:GGOE01029212.1.p9 GENE.GGOE01029212.1~~GGOE01029212.1.p9  ORF type:complete len:102 (+),score=2.26 GGOE01029212.1:104-409(+)
MIPPRREDARHCPGGRLSTDGSAPRMVMGGSKAPLSSKTAIWDLTECLLLACGHGRLASSRFRPSPAPPDGCLMGGCQGDDRETAIWWFVPPDPFCPSHIP